MAAFRCTNKLLKHLNVKPCGEIDASHTKTTLGDWYANLIMADRRKVVIWTNEQTLFSFVMLKVRANRPDLFNLGFVRGLAMSLQIEDIPLPQVERILREYAGPMDFCKTKNSSVVASMNRIGQGFEHMVWYEHGFKHCDIGELVHRLNNTPWKAIGYNFASELVRERCNSQCQ